MGDVSRGHLERGVDPFGVADERQGVQFAGFVTDGDRIDGLACCFKAEDRLEQCAGRRVME